MIASVDGCRAGWLVAIASSWPPTKTPHLCICRTFEDVLALTQPCEIVVVDMPIGLPRLGEVRLCDKLARESLGSIARSRVFDAPPRELLGAGDVSAFQQAHHASFGKGAGLPVWGLVPKLRELDALMTPLLQERVREFHPELAWLRLCGRPLASKHAGEGLKERCDLLETRVVSFEELRIWKAKVGRAASVDDVLDSLVGLAVAGGLVAEPRDSRRIPDEPPTDDKGLRMEIWC